MLWSAFYDLVLPEVPGVATALVDLALRRTAIDLCTQSGIYSLTPTSPITVQEEIGDYTLVSPDNQAEPIFVWSVEYIYGTSNNVNASSSTLGPTTLAILEGLADYWRNRVGNPVAFTQLAPNTLTLFPLPGTNDVPAILLPRIALRPISTATGLADTIANEYMDGIASGAKARLMRMPNKPWTSLGNSQMYQSEYSSARLDAKIAAQRTFAPAPLQVGMPLQVSQMKVW